jgi:hypothetical protein
MITLLPDPKPLRAPDTEALPEWYRARLAAAHAYLDEREINRNRHRCDHRYVPALPVLPRNSSA